ncbi:helix-turn-helix transcriptional regulator [Streptomyces sp. NPDC055709]
MHIRDSRRFTELLRLQELSQRKLASIAHVSQAFISLLAHGRRGARPETAWRIANALGVRAEELFSSAAHTTAPATTPTSGATATAPATVRPPLSHPTATHFARHELTKRRRLTRAHRPRAHRTTSCTTDHDAA